jgi:hypothetical protein
VHDPAPADRTAAGVNPSFNATSLKDITMNTKTSKTAARASLTQLQGLATQGVERALAARMTELNAEQVQAVSGGAAGYTLAKGYLINGIINPEILKKIQLGGISQPAINTGITNGLPAGNVATQGILIGL